MPVGAPDFMKNDTSPPCAPERIANLLIVDDSAANLQLLARLFKPGAFKVRPVPSGELALQAARQDPPDLILLDINMPGMNGFEVCQELKADETLKEIPVIFLTAIDDAADKVKAFAVGGVDYVTKPFQFEEVEARVRTHLALRRQERQLQAQNAQLREARRLNESLVQMTLHDVCTPLSAIQTALATLPELKPSESATAASLIKSASNACLRMQKLIASLLDLARLEAGQMPIRPAPHDLVATLRGSVESLAVLAGRRRLLLDLPDQFELPHDPDVLRRVVDNLLLNAFQHAPEAGEVKLTLRPEGDQVRVSVTDNGRGIPREFHERIFEKFSQAELRSQVAGPGLGLAFCKLAVEAHGGSIGVESDPAGGSTFWFRLPVGPTT